MKGRKVTEEVQSTTARKKVSTRRAMLRGKPATSRVSVQKKTQQKSSHGAQTDDEIDDRCLVQCPGPETVHQSHTERPHVGHLNDDGQVRRQVPALRDLWDEQRQFNPQPIDGHPGAHPEQDGQEVSEERHGDGGDL